MNKDMLDETAIVRKVTLRIIPFVFLLYIVSYLDRANIRRRRLADEQRTGAVQRSIRVYLRHLFHWLFSV